MNEEGIDYKPNTQIVVHLAGTSRRLSAPTADQVLEWEEQVQDELEVVQDRLEDYRLRIAEAEEGSAEQRKLERELSRFSRKPNYEFTLMWLQDVFDTLTTGFPPREDWPAWLLSQRLPGQFLQHWRNVPLVSGDRQKSPTPDADG